MNSSDEEVDDVQVWSKWWRKVKSHFHWFTFMSHFHLLTCCHGGKWLPVRLMVCDWYMHTVSVNVLMVNWPDSCGVDAVEQSLVLLMEDQSSVIT